MRVPNADRCLRVLPDNVSDEAAVFLADILPTGYGSVVRGGVGPESTVVVVGCSPGRWRSLRRGASARHVSWPDGIAERRELRHVGWSTGRRARRGAERRGGGDRWHGR